MAKHSWSWGETATGDSERPRKAGPWSGKAAGCSISVEGLQGGLRQGVELVTVDNGAIRFAIVPTRGMGLWKVWRGDLELGWQSPVAGPAHPALVPLHEPSGLGWLAGFDELVARCGLESNGPPVFDEAGRLVHPLHGRIANRPARRVMVSVDEATGRIEVSGVVEETRFHFAKLRMTSTFTTEAGQGWVSVRDEIENLSASPGEARMLYHINFGAPLLEAGAEVVAPWKTIVPRNDHAASGLPGWTRYGGPTAGFEEQVYFTELKGDGQGETAVLLKNAAGDRGASLHFNTNALPCFTVWKNTTALADGYVTGLEPGTNFPNSRPHEGAQGRVISLAPGGKQVLEVRIAAHATSAEVQEVAGKIEALQGGEAPQIHKAPQPGWCEGV